MFKKILTVCTGNICRSPAAEAMLKHKLQSSYPDVEIQSAGVGALVGHGAHEQVIKILGKQGIDVTQHRARQINSALVGWSDLILVMENTHADDVGARYPAARGKVFKLGKWKSINVPDPFRQSEQFFIENMQLIDECVDEWCKKVWS